MNQKDLMKHIAETAYNVGFGAKKHFATFDIVAKAPGTISFISLAFGVYALVFESLGAKAFSATFIILGVLGIYISFYDAKKTEYIEAGQKLTDLFNELKRLYGRVRSTDGPYEDELNKLEEIEDAYTKLSHVNQIALANWYAHYKFFWEQQIGWIDQELEFKFFRDKIPLTLTLTLLAVVFGGIILLLRSEILVIICSSGSP